MIAPSHKVLRGFFVSSIYLYNMKFKDTVKEILVEQKWYEAVKDSLIAAASPITGAVILLNKALQLYRGANFKKIRLIFPKANWEIAAVTIFQKLGVVTGVYTSLEEANMYLVFKKLLELVK